MITEQKVRSFLPYKDPFLFVDHLFDFTPEGISGMYTFPVNATFYKGHFKDNPVTPGVLLTECMAQIGVVSFGIYLQLKDGKSVSAQTAIAMTESTVKFEKLVYPGETVTVKAEKQFYRFQKLKCNVKLFKASGELVCYGSLSGMIIPKNNEK